MWGGIKLREQFGAAYNKKPYFLLNFKSSNSFIHKGHKLKQKINKI
ncbi:MAG: hypothetical protein MRERV_45c003 [Mycoplasmataceae bacterium RV_VA103A]|nr:MAG: hypothetical protein MRERV_45c003 [Mycoplasmataceae bacterium RV_VA103A]